MKRVSMELGGNAPFLVFEDADLEVAVGCAKGARFYNNGQICIGANRILVHEDVYEELDEEQYRALVAKRREDVTVEAPPAHRASPSLKWISPYSFHQTQPELTFDGR